ncbi:MAG: hypothetical protein J3K34DRAFT_424772 [Monoraphidium minutum]|nr:MAG: hypothetical protein J3K34DRAFT_424772 [Monoraphidium minutum]
MQNVHARAMGWARPFPSRYRGAWESGRGARARTRSGAARSPPSHKRPAALGSPQKLTRMAEVKGDASSADDRGRAQPPRHGKGSRQGAEGGTGAHAGAGTDAFGLGRARGARVGLASAREGGCQWGIVQAPPGERWQGSGTFRRRGPRGPK